jgi:hypothetical protein
MSIDYRGWDVHAYTADLILIWENWKLQASRAHTTNPPSDEQVNDATNTQTEASSSNLDLTKESPSKQPEVNSSEAVGQEEQLGAGNKEEIMAVVKTLQLFMSAEDKVSLMSKIQARLEARYVDPAQSQQSEEYKALEKISSRYVIEYGGYEDSALKNLNVLRLLEATWNSIIKLNEPSMESLFFETLADVSSTCPEGDSHRLFFLLHALITSTSNQ